GRVVVVFGNVVVGILHTGHQAAAVPPPGGGQQLAVEGIAQTTGAVQCGDFGGRQRPVVDLDVGHPPVEVGGCRAVVLLVLVVPAPAKVTGTEVGVAGRGVSDRPRLGADQRAVEVEGL